MLIVLRFLTLIQTNSADPDQTALLSSLILVHTVCHSTMYFVKQMHRKIEIRTKVWNKVVRTLGHLLYFNNRMFFDVCDGIFLNYCWKDENLKASKSLAVEVNRPYDVYIGIDVFGRGCLGDGGFNTCEVCKIMV